jgi:hypothetical protein
MIFTQTSFIPYLTTITSIGRAARSGAAFFGPGYIPSEGDVKFVGAMGILGMASYAFTFVGAISFMQFSLFAFQSGNYKQRAAKYYEGRMRFYTAMLMIAGLAQLLLGSYLAANFGRGGRLENGTVGVAMFVVNYPAISIFIGLIQMINTAWGFARSFCLGVLANVT